MKIVRSAAPIFEGPVEPFRFSSLSIAVAPQVPVLREFRNLGQGGADNTRD